jgi:single-stranded DNA-binding protein
MIDALLSGRLHGAPVARTASNGNQFATAKVRVSGRDGEAHYANVIAFDEAAVAALLALSAGDSVALAGELTPKVWTDKDGTARPSLDLVAHAVLTPFHVARRRKAVRSADSQAPFDDDLSGAA